MVLQPPPSAIFVICFVEKLVASFLPNSSDQVLSTVPRRRLLSRASLLLGNVVITELEYRDLSDHRDT